MDESKSPEELLSIIRHVMGTEFGKATLNSGIKLGLVITVDVTILETNLSTTYLPVPLLRKVDFIDIMISYIWTVG